MRPELMALAASLAAREERFALVTVVCRELPRLGSAPDAVPRVAYGVLCTLGSREREITDAAVARAPAYVGVIARSKRYAPLRAALLAQRVSREALDRIAAPAGLDIGART